MARSLVGSKSTKKLGEPLLIPIGIGLVACLLAVLVRRVPKYRADPAFHQAHQVRVTERGTKCNVCEAKMAALPPQLGVAPRRPSLE